jgi:hypothetical protein
MSRSAAVIELGLLVVKVDVPAPIQIVSKKQAVSISRSVI